MVQVNTAVPAKGRKAAEISYSEWPITSKSCTLCKETKPITEFQKILNKKGFCSLCSWCKPCKTRSSLRYTKPKVVKVHEPVPRKCQCGQPCRPINHYKGWMEMECSVGHLWYESRDRVREMVLSNS